MDNFSCYIRLDNRTPKDAKTPQYEVTETAGYFPPLETLKNPKNRIVFYLIKNDNGINCRESRKAGYHLQCKDSVNFSSIYVIETTGGGVIAYGEPQPGEFLKPKKDKKTGKETPRPNPFYHNRNDGYLFIISQDWSVIEVLVVQDGRHLIRGTAQKLADARFDEALKTMRGTAKPILKY